MTYLDIDIHKNKESKAMLKEVDKFTREVMRPAGIELDKLSDPADVIEENSLLWEVLKAFRALDLHQIDIPKDLGGMSDLDWMTSLLIKERMGHADAGLAIGMMASNLPFQCAATSKSPVLQQIVRDYCEDRECRMIGCWAPMEVVQKSGGSTTGNNSSRKSPVKAVPNKNRLILNGELIKISNATIATHALISFEFEVSGQTEGSGVAMVPLDLPGVSRGTPLNKIGQRTLNQATIIFQNVEIPVEYMLAKDDSVVNEMSRLLNVGTNLNLGIVFAGLSLAAFDEALNYSKMRIQGGGPIFSHRNIKLQLFKMFAMVESVRANARRLANYASENPNSPSEAHGAAAKYLATETAINISSEAIQIFGGNGLAKEYPLEKIFRDAQTSLVEYGVNDVMAIKSANHL
ncbi:MAG: acyl-CoA dehydrogenase family protein [Thermodesulfobacteriota bacterium]|nr:acyl-CoA dehydrogenase family protein [Thermodesulfobacteriota bacterium]